jgi:hypothetical protein
VGCWCRYLHGREISALQLLLGVTFWPTSLANPCPHKGSVRPVRSCSDVGPTKHLACNYVARWIFGHKNERSIWFDAHFFVC